MRNFGRLHFNSRPREGGDHKVCILYQDQKISIRAPARGATDLLMVCDKMYLFQFAPPRGGRHIRVLRSSCRLYFNSRPREGGDFSAFLHIELHGISIRAPARGATRRSNSLKPWKQFQFAPPRGGRHQEIKWLRASIAISIRAPARGATLSACVAPWSL